MTRLRSPSVLFATSELAPLIKTGGLADVSRALPSTLARRRIDVRIVMPAYRAVLERLDDVRTVARARVASFDIELLETELEPGLPLWLIKNPLFDRPGTPYQDPGGLDWSDNADRFGCFCHAIVWLANGGAGEAPQVVHLNDWQTGPAAALLSLQPERPRTLFSVHNLEYQGLFDASAMDRLSFPARLWTLDGLEFFGRTSFIKGGLAFADSLTTVSPTYAREILTPEGGRGLDALLCNRSDRLKGITNGIDEAQWNPETDPHLAMHFSAASIEGKAANKAALQQELGLEESAMPVFGIVSRLAPQKGMDLVLDIVDRLVALPAELAVLGSGERALEEGFVAAAARHPGRVSYARRFDERLAHVIEAGADMLLMPSRFEPCGLNQMYSMRYGTVPVVRRTGGLADTVEPAHEPNGTGFLFDEPSATALWCAVEEALEMFVDVAQWRSIQRNGMLRDFSWSRSAAHYVDLYRALAGS